MRPLWKDNRLTVELHKPDIAVLEKARSIGQALVAMNQENGQALVDATEAILSPKEEVE